MERLESAAEGSVRRLATGYAGDLPKGELEVLARWLAKTVLVLERGDDSNRVAQPAHFTALMAGVLPDRFVGWLFPLEPNTEVRLRSTVIDVWTGQQLADGNVYADELTVLRISSIVLHQVHMLTIMGDGPWSGNLVWSRDPTKLLGPPPHADSDRPLHWPPTLALPVDFAYERHEQLVEWLMS